jgi:alpha-L-arabinofuranosidase
VLALVNLDPHKAAVLSANISGARVNKVSGSVLSGEAMDARNTFESPHVVEPKPFTAARLSGGKLSLSLPAKSLVVVTLE